MNHKKEAIKRVEEYKSVIGNDVPLTEIKQCALLAIDREIELVVELSLQSFSIGIIDKDLNDMYNKKISDLKQIKQEIEKL